jgi:hypothetical protein
LIQLTKNLRHETGSEFRERGEEGRRFEEERFVDVGLADEDLAPNEIGGFGAEVGEEG